MKKIIMLLLSVGLVLCFVGCSGKNDVKYESSFITARFVSGSETGKEVVFSDEDVSEVLEVLNDSKWSEGVTKTVYNYILELEGNTLYYSFKQGLINDKENFRHLKLSDEEKAYINSIILERIEYKSSSISVQQIDDGFVLVLEKLKNEDAEKILSIWNSGEWEEWFCSDENQEYVFSLSDGETQIYYTEGYFYDVKNNRYLSATRDQREYINALLNQIYKQ